jgi:sporulation protein YlmC with PRC-barrel domain
MSKADLARHPFDLALALLDRQLIDSDGRRCGKADDLVLEGEAGGELRVVALRVGPGAMGAEGHGALSRLSARLFRADETVEVPLAAIAEVKSELTLDRPAAEFGLARGDRRAAAIIRRIPGS